MFEREKLPENNFNDWFHQLKLVLRVEKKMFVIEQPIPSTIAANSAANVLAEWHALYDAHNEVACLMLGSMTPKLHRQFENYSPYEMLQELRSMFKKQAGVESDFTGFVRNYNMHNMRKTIGKLHVMLIEYENGLPKKAETLQVMMIKGGKIQKSNKKSLKAKGKGLESVEARIVVYQQNEYVFEEDIKLLKLEIQLRDNALVSLRQTLEKAEQERDYLKLKSDESLPPCPIYDRYQSGNGYHAVPPPYTGTFMPPKTDLVFNNAPNDVETDHSAFNGLLSSMLRLLFQLQLLRQPFPQVTRSRHDKHIVTKPTSPLKRHINHSPSPKASAFLPKVTAIKATMGNPQNALKDKGVIDSGCSRHMTGNMSYLSDFEELNGGYVAFGGNPKGGKIFGKGNMSYLSDFKEINGGYVAFGGNPKGGKISGKDTECIVLSPEFKLPDENQVLLRVPRENNMYNVDLKNNVPSMDLTCLFAKATLDESNLWYRRLGHINFITMNKLVKGNLVRGLPSKFFENNYTCVACKKGKQHRASCKTNPVSSVNQSLQRLHMDLFGPTFVKSLDRKSYCLVVTNDYSRFTWVFFLATKDETSPILKNFITGIENQLSLKVKIIRSDNGTEFKNNYINQLCRMKGIKKEFSVPRTAQQNGITERKNRTLIEAARTMLADSLVPIYFGLRQLILLVMSRIGY
nr:putative ribonuclease H-like domain-containing protein [Tanacetum cinerariifolium]